MKKNVSNPGYQLRSYIDDNREKLDESLVSLRFMKEVHDFLEINGISHREFAENLSYSESFVSQLMSGTKKFNAAFINSFEKVYDIVINFNIEKIKESDYIVKLNNSHIEMSLKHDDSTSLIGNSNEIFEFSTNTVEFSSFKGIEEAIIIEDGE